MSSTLFLRLGERATWLVRGPDTFLPMGHGTLEEAAQHAAGNRVVVLAPAADTLLTEARLPAKQTRHLRQAVPFAIEEQLSDDVERLHFALAAKRTADGAQPVAVVARDRMQWWFAQLEAAGLHPSAMIPDVLALPLAEGEWSLLLDAHGALLRTGMARGYAFDAESAETLLTLAFEQAAENRPARLRLFNCGGNDLSSIHTACAAAQVEVMESGCGGGSLTLLAEELQQRPAAIDLLQGDFSRREDLRKLWRPWLPVAVLLGLWLVLQTGLGIYHYVTLSRESAQLQSEIEEVYRKAFPEARNVSNPRLQMEQHLKQLRGGSSAFAALMVKSTPVLRSEPGVELGAIRFKDDMLEVEITVADFQAMDRLKQAFSGKGLSAEVQNASARGGRTSGVLRLREGK